ncbi:glycoside hydrolase family 47 protein [Saccharopolyspora pogona]|nr:glycoside hydrolase family 47 protein [Saccharopolyspora pogona]
MIPSAVDYATKYYWLLFSDTPRFDYQNNYLNTEANVLRGARC